MTCRCWHGHSDQPFPTELIHQWQYKGEHLPRNESPQIHINFWCIEEPPSDLKEHEVIISEFKFIKGTSKNYVRNEKFQSEPSQER